MSNYRGEIDRLEAITKVRCNSETQYSDYNINNELIKWSMSGRFVTTSINKDIYMENDVAVSTTPLQFVGSSTDAVYFLAIKCIDDSDIVQISLDGGSTYQIVLTNGQSVFLYPYSSLIEDLYVKTISGSSEIQYLCLAG